MGDITIRAAVSVRALYRHAVFTKCKYERVRARIQALSHILNHTKKPELWRAAARRAIRLGAKYRRRMNEARTIAREMLLYDPIEIWKAVKTMAESEATVKAFEEQRRKSLC